MKTITLKNELITATIQTKGAELQSLLHKNGIQYMWNGNPAFWGKHSPVLFPIVGTLKNDYYIFNGKQYHLPRHGFARDMVFTAKQLNKQEAVFTLKEDENTLKVYPFQFVFKLHYRLAENRLLCTYEVSNPANSDLFFSVGGHPAFALPLTKGTQYSDYYLAFSIAEPIYRYKLENGLTSTGKELVQAIACTPATEHGTIKIPLKQELFYDDALVLKRLENHCTTLACDKHEHGLHFDFTGFPYLGIWAAKDAPFICIEPWCGITDNIEHNHQLKDKEGIVALKAGGTWQRTWSVECY